MTLELVDKTRFQVQRVLVAFVRYRSFLWIRYRYYRLTLSGIPTGLVFIAGSLSFICNISKGVLFVG